MAQSWSTADVSTSPAKEVVERSKRGMVLRAAKGVHFSWTHEHDQEQSVRHTLRTQTSKKVHHPAHEGNESNIYLGVAAARYVKTTCAHTHTRARKRRSTKREVPLSTEAFHEPVVRPGPKVVLWPGFQVQDVRAKGKHHRRTTPVSKAGTGWVFPFWSEEEAFLWPLASLFRAKV